MVIRVSHQATRQNRKGILLRCLPLDEFKIEDGRLTFKHLGAHYRFMPEPSYTVQWTTFNNLTGEERR